MKPKVIKQRDRVNSLYLLFEDTDACSKPVVCNSLQCYKTRSAKLYVLLVLQHLVLFSNNSSELQSAEIKFKKHFERRACEV